MLPNIYVAFTTLVYEAQLVAPDNPYFYLGGGLFTIFAKILFDFVINFTRKDRRTQSQQTTVFHSKEYMDMKFDAQSEVLKKNVEVLESVSDSLKKLVWLSEQQQNQQLAAGSPRVKAATQGGL